MGAASWRVTHVCRTGWPVVGGMETVIHGLARAQVAAGHRVEVITLLHALDDGRGLPDVDHEGVRYRRLHRVGPRRYPFAYGLRRAVRGADLVHVHGLDGLADRLARARQRPLMGVSTHGGYFHSRRNPWVKEALLRSITCQTLWQADAVWFTSEVDRRRFASVGVVGTVVPNGVELEPFARTDRAPQSGRWVVVGRIDRHKGLDRLLDAMARVGRPAELRICGPDAGGGVRRALERQVARLGLESRVRFEEPGGVDQLAAHLASSELAIFPSRHESFGVAVVEAMAAGCCVVASDIAAHKALIEPGVTGFLVDFDQPETAAAELERLADLDSTEVSRAAREAAQRHSWTVRLANWDEAYQQLLRARITSRWEDA